MLRKSAKQMVVDAAVICQQHGAANHKGVSIKAVLNRVPGEGDFLTQSLPECARMPFAPRFSKGPNFIKNNQLMLWG